MALHAQKAPVELAGEFVSAVMRRDYHNALVLCQALLLLEPNNETYLEFEKVLSETKANILARINNVAHGGRDIDESESDSEIETDSSSDGDNYDEETDSSDSGNSDSSGDAYMDGINNNNDKESEDVSSDSDDDYSNDELTPDEISRLNLLVGGLHINRT